MIRCPKCGRQFGANVPKSCPECGESISGLTLSPRKILKDSFADAEFYLYALLGLLGIAFVVVVVLIGYRLF